MHKSPVQNGALITTIIGRLGPSPAERVDRVTCLNNHLMDAGVSVGSTGVGATRNTQYCG